MKRIKGIKSWVMFLTQEEITRHKHAKQQLVTRNVSRSFLPPFRKKGKTRLIKGSLCNQVHFLSTISQKLLPLFACLIKRLKQPQRPFTPSSFPCGSSNCFKSDSTAGRSRTPRFGFDSSRWFPCTTSSSLFQMQDFLWNNQIQERQEEEGSMELRRTAKNRI